MQRRDFLTRVALALTIPPSLYACSSVAELVRREPGRKGGRLQLTQRHLAVVDQACEAIIPTTDTPGARTAEVPQFIALLLQEWMDDTEQVTFIKGLEELDARFLAQQGSAMEDASDSLVAEFIEEQAGVLASPEDSEFKSFFKQLRGLTIIGYFTSEIGQKQALNVEFGAGQNTEVGPAMAQTYSA